MWLAFRPIALESSPLLYVKVQGLALNKKEDRLTKAAVFSPRPFLCGALLYRVFAIMVCCGMKYAGSTERHEEPLLTYSIASVSICMQLVWRRTVTGTHTDYDSMFAYL